jgi:hypothetical protein
MTKTRKQRTPKNTTKRRPNNTVPITISFFDHITAIVYKIIDVFTGNRGYQEFLERKGVTNAEAYAMLMRKKIKIKSDISFILNEVINDILAAREKRRYYYINQIHEYNSKLAALRRNIEKNAINEIKARKRNIFKIYSMKYGFFGAIKLTRKYLIEHDIDRKYIELIDYYLSKSNVALVERIIIELKNVYLYEEYFFINCLQRLYKKYNHEFYDIFRNNNYEKSIIPYKTVNY